MEIGEAVTCFLESWLNPTGWESTFVCAQAGVSVPHPMAGGLIRYTSGSSLPFFYSLALDWATTLCDNFVLS